MADYVIGRLQPAVVRMIHERLSRHCKYRVTSSMTSRDQNMYTEYSLTILSHIVLAMFARTSREIFLPFHANQ
jgi:hypothetical protein